MTLEAAGPFITGAKIQYLCILVCGEALFQLGTFSAEVEIKTTYHLKLFFLCLGTYFPC